jgi:hypothetical protein
MCSSETKPHPTRPILIFAIADVSGTPLLKTPYSKSGSVLSTPLIAWLDYSSADATR